MVETNEWTTVNEILDKLPQFAVTKKDIVTCSKHGRYKQTTYQSGRITNCPGCERDSKKKRIADENKKLKEAEKERKSRRIDELLGNSGIPKRFQGKTLDNYKSNSQKQKEIINNVEKFLKEFKEPQGHSGRCLTMIGKAGTGKTHLACAVASHVIKHYGGTARFSSVSEINRLVRESKSYNTKYSETEIIEAFGNYDLLIVDEVGIQSGTDAESRALFDVINARYQNMNPTIFISNLNKDQLKAALGERIYDRIKEGGGVILGFDWDSYRG
ncbi:ATP-binding protein [Snodgrassella sp. W8158]|uniref:ATP-binding protein n=1 Tax=Snodgrassella sp. W8158 TaxID=2751018 RepID=UPI0018DE0F91|nr:ATP-binding protein [Snodgrassella sp. W8158]MBI0182241.1 ATP-binding protein [Snodgrassella sp. W8158]